MKSINPYIFIENCKDVMEYYEKTLDGEIKNVQQSDDGKYLHAELHVGESVIHFSDVFGDITKGGNMKVLLEFDNQQQIQKVYDSLMNGGQATVELQDTFWGALHANVTDKYGVGWLLNYQQ